MFRIENNQVLYKTSEMISEVHFGNLQIAELLGENKYCVKKFNVDNGNYEVDTTVTSYNFNGTDYMVVDGCFTVSPTPEPIVEPTAQDFINADILLAQAEQTARLTAIDEALAVILINNAGGVL